MVLCENDNLIKKIEEKIDELGFYFEQNKAVILTEMDLQCLVYKKLLEIKELSKIKQTSDIQKFKTHSIHTEVSWFDENNKLTLKPDITLIEPKFLSIKQSNPKLKHPSKGCYFKGGGIIFELKFNRYKSSKRFLSEIKKDFEKFEKIKQRHLDVYCFFIVFNKTNKKSEELKSFLIKNESSSTHKLIYKTANV